MLDPPCRACSGMVNFQELTSQEQYLESLASTMLPPETAEGRRRQIRTLWSLLPKALKLKSQEGRGQALLTQFGLSPRSTGKPLLASLRLPWVTRLLVEVLREVFPGEVFTTVMIRENQDHCPTPPHKDKQNSHLPNLIWGVTSYHNAGLWVETPGGTERRVAQGVWIPGCNLDIQRGAVFSARCLWHGGQATPSNDVATHTEAKRLVLIGFVGGNILSSDADTLLWLRSMSFAVPTEALVLRARDDVRVGDRVLRQSRLRFRRLDEVSESDRGGNGGNGVAPAVLQVLTNREALETTHNKRPAPRLESSAKRLCN